MEALFGADYERITDDNAVDLEADVEDLTATWKACATAGTIVSAMLKRDGEHFGKVVDRQTIEVDGETQKRVLISTGFQRAYFAAAPPAGSAHDKSAET